MGGKKDRVERDGPSTMDLARNGSANFRQVRQFSLRVLSGPDSGQSWLGGERAVIGTHPSADLTLTDRAVSRFHCEIAAHDHGMRLRDLGSRNGILVDGISLLDGYLGESATLTLGRNQVRFELGGSPCNVAISERSQFGEMVGRSLAMRSLFAVLERAAQSDATVLLGGETGTGKELAARAIHHESRRRDQPFIVVDCGTIPATLLESELFGHERGAFTGAQGAHEGAFESASGGTIFLDEIGELSLELQPKLLRVIENGQIRRLGTTHHSTVDVRVVAASNRDLKAEVNARRFRSDLYYRLAVIELVLPPLRERLDDLPLLIERMLQKQPGPDDDRLHAPELAAQLARYAWPGNLRELRNYLIRCQTLGSAPSPGEDASPPTELPVQGPLKLARAEFDRKYLEEMLRRHDDNVTAAARAAGIDRIQFYRLLWRHGLRSRESR